MITATGIADCLMPYAIPRREGGTACASMTFPVPCNRALPRPPTASSSRSPVSVVTPHAMPRQAVALSAAAVNVDARPDSRSMKAPPASVATAAAPKKQLAARPRLASSSPKSARTTTAWALSRSAASRVWRVLRPPPPYGSSWVHPSHPAQRSRRRVALLDWPPSGAPARVPVLLSGQQPPRDHQALHLVSALVDLRDLGVAHHPFHREVTGVTVATQQLDRVGGHLHGDV